MFLLMVSLIRPLILLNREILLITSKIAKGTINHHITKIAKPRKKKINLRGVDILLEYIERVIKVLKTTNEMNLTAV